MDAAALEARLREQIPLAAAMQVVVERVDADEAVLQAPLAPNSNPSSTVFGGSATALAMLAAWSLVHARLAAGGREARVVVQRHAMSHDRALAGDFRARASLADAKAWPRFERTLARRGRARIEVAAVLERPDREPGAHFTGTFAALT